MRLCPASRLCVGMAALFTCSPHLLLADMAMTRAMLTVQVKRAAARRNRVNVILAMMDAAQMEVEASFREFLCSDVKAMKTKYQELARTLDMAHAASLLCLPTASPSDW